MATATQTVDLGSGVVRNGKNYKIDGEEVKGIMLRWKKYRSRIDEMERAAGFFINKKGHRVPLKVPLGHMNRNAVEAELPVEANMEEQEESETDYGSHEEESVEAQEPKNKSIPKPKKKTAKRPKMK